MFSQQDMSRIYFFILLILASILMIIFASSFIHALIFAFILGGILYPYNEWMHRKLKINRGLSSVIISLLLVVLLLIPFVVIVYQASVEGVLIYERLYAFFNDHAGDYTLDRTVDRIVSLLASFKLDVSPLKVENFITTSLENISLGVVNSVSSLSAGILNFIGQFLLMMLMIVGVLIYGFRLRSFVLELFPHNKRDDVRLLIAKFNSTNKATLVVNLFASVFQGFAMSVVLLFAYFPSVIFWSFLIGVSALVPVLGILSICLPIALYYYLAGKLTAAITIAVISIAIYAFTENFLKPKMMGKGTNINPIMLLLSVIGGVSTFGILGLFYGPLVLGMFLTLFEIYKNQTNEASGVK